jgi:hypothetical protein
MYLEIFQSQKSIKLGGKMFGENYWGRLRIECYTQIMKNVIIQRFSRMIKEETLKFS